MNEYTILEQGTNPGGTWAKFTFDSGNEEWHIDAGMHVSLEERIQLFVDEHMRNKKAWNALSPEAQQRILAKDKARMDRWQRMDGYPFPDGYVPSDIPPDDTTDAGATAITDGDGTATTTGEN